MNPNDYTPNDKKKIIDNQLNLLKVKPELYPRVYQPTILQYQCIGALHLRSSPNIDKNQTSYQCIGLEKKIKTVNHLPPTTYSNSINNFKRLFMNNSSLYPKKEYGKILGNVTAFGGRQNTDNNQSIEDNKNTKDNILILDKKFPDLKKLFSIEKVESDEFNYVKHYGKTNVNILLMSEIVTMNKVMKNGSKEIYKSADKIIAVAPNMKNGMTIRGTDVDVSEYENENDSKGNKTNLVHELTTVQIGSIELTIGKTRDISPETDTLKKLDFKQLFKNSDDYIEIAQNSIKRGMNQVKFTANFLQGTVQDDFFNRVVVGGGKVVNNFKKSFTNMKKFFDWITKQ